LNSWDPNRPFEGKNTKKKTIICIVVVAALKAFSSDKESHSLQSTYIDYITFLTLCEF